MRVEVSSGGWTLTLGDEPPGVDERRVLVDRLGDDEERRLVHVLVASSGRPPCLLVTGRVRDPFLPGVHLVAETETLFVGCAESLAIYDLGTVARKHLDVTPYAFNAWARHGDVVLMCGELEVAAYDLEGSRLWAATIEPPWDYDVTGDLMTTNVLGHKRSFPLREGPQDDLLVSR